MIFTLTGLLQTVLRFHKANRDVFLPDDPVSLRVVVKNVAQLKIQVCSC